jgi:hypothetical protein
MASAGRITPQQEDVIFADRSSARMPVPGTVSRTSAVSRGPFFTGREKDGGYTTRLPVPVDDTVAGAGRDLYGAYCSVCHGAAGAGDGMVVRRGFTKPRSFADAALVRARPGYLFSVIHNGSHDMDSFRDLVDERGSWAIVAYIRELQRSHDNATD